MKALALGMPSLPVLTQDLVFLHRISVVAEPGKVNLS